MSHEIWKGQVLAALINIDGAWMDTIKRKLTLPPEVIIPVFENAPKSKDFSII
jgi:acyl-CoA thioester hydrolase